MSKRLNGTKPVQLIFPKGEVSKTEQAHAAESDINIIMAKAMRGESSDYIKEYGGRYGDTTSMDFFEANILIANANEMFDALPSALRNRFQNQPGQFLDFVQDPRNKDELIKLKLANQPEKITSTPAETPAETPVTTETKTTTKETSASESVPE